MKIFLITVTFIVMVALPFTSCSGSSLPPEEAISKTGEAIEEMQSYRVENKGYFVDEQGEHESGSIVEFVAPDKLHILPLNESDNGDVMESIRIGSVEYIKEVNGDNWTVRNWPESVSVRDNYAAGIVKALGSLTGLKTLRNKKVEGVECFHYSGYFDTAAQAAERKVDLDPSQPDYEGQLEMIKILENTNLEYEFWIGKDDFLLRKIKMNMEVSYTRHEGEENESEEYHSSEYIMRLYDFNVSIQIDAPITGETEGVYLVASMSSLGNGGDDLEHYPVGYEITISNRGLETAGNLRIFIDSPATNQGWQTMEAEPGQKPVDLGPGESMDFLVSWEYNLAASSKEEFIELIRDNVLRANWFDEDGQPHEDVLIEE